MRRSRATLAGLTAVAIALSSCGKSIYSPVAEESSKDALLERAVLAMDKKDFKTARASLEKIWPSDKSNDLTQLYANAILGSAGFDLYEIIVNLLKSASNADIKSANDLLDALASVVTVDANDQQLDDLSLTLQVLNQAENQNSQALDFQKCLTVGIYALPVLDGIQVAVENIQSTLDSLPARVSVDPSDNRSCTAQTSTIEAVGQDLSLTISQIGTISARITEVNEVIGNCSLAANSSATQDVNALTARVQTILDQSDRGCVLPSSGQLGNRVFPSCMVAFVEATASNATAGDGQVAGCEVFVNCAQGGCF
jgi:hypothetical protein